MARPEDASPISVQFDRRLFAEQTKRGVATFLGAIARLIDPEFDQQDMRSLTPAERARSLEIAQRAAEANLGKLAMLSTEFNLLGGRKAARTNPQAARLLQQIESREQTLAEIKIGEKPVINIDQIYLMETACQAAAEGLRQASAITIVNAVGLDNVIGMLMEGTPPDKIVQPVDDLLQQAIRALNQQTQR